MFRKQFSDIDIYTGNNDPNKFMSLLMKVTYFNKWGTW